MAKKIIVEFLGLSGVGKSTFCAKVAAELSNEGVVVCLPNEFKALSLRNKKMSCLISPKFILELASFLLYVLSHLNYIIQLTKIIISSGQRTKEDLKWLLHTWYKRSYLMHNCRKMPGVHLFDEGIFQALWGVGFSSRKEKFISEIKGLYHIMPVPDMVIIFEASLTNIEARLASRPYQETRVEKMRRQEFDVLAKGAVLMDEVNKIIREIAARSKTIKIVTVDNNELKHFEDNVKVISGFILGNTSAA